MFFSESTHKARWLFTEAQLERLREQLHTSQAADEETAEQHQDKRHAGGSEGPATTPPPPAPRGAAALPVTVQEVQRLLKFYESKVPVICKQTRLPKKVQATALAYFKRYHLRVPIAASEPLRVLLTCIYLAAKIEESYISAEELCRAVNQEPPAVLRAEVPLLTSLGFDLVVHSPYRALAGLLTYLEDLQAEAAAMPGAGDADGGGSLEAELLKTTPEALRGLKAAADSALDALMLTDAPLLYDPCALALAALRSAARARGGPRLHAFFARCVAQAQAAQQQQQQQEGGAAQGGGPEDGQGPSDDPTVTPEQVAALEASLLASMDRLDRLGMAGSQKVDQQEVGDIDRRLKQWKAALAGQDPGASAAKQAAEAKAKAERREAKLRARREAAAAQEAELLGTVQPPKAAAPSQ